MDTRLNCFKKISFWSVTCRYKHIRLKMNQNEIPKIHSICWETMPMITKFRKHYLEFLQWTCRNEGIKTSFPKRNIIVQNDQNGVDEEVDNPMFLTGYYSKQSQSGSQTQGYRVQWNFDNLSLTSLYSIVINSVCLKWKRPMWRSADFHLFVSIWTSRNKLVECGMFMRPSLGPKDHSFS